MNNNQTSNNSINNTFPEDIFGNPIQNQPQINSNLNLHFLTKCPRFINNNIEREESPGPGSYNLNDKPLFRKRLFNKKKFL